MSFDDDDDDDDDDVDLHSGLARHQRLPLVTLVFCEKCNSRLPLGHAFATWTDTGHSAE